MSNSIRIGVDMAATVGQKSGLGSYVDEVVKGMQGLKAQDEIIEFHRVKKNLRTPQRWLHDQIGVPFSAFTKKTDVLFVPAFSAPRTRKPVVMTAHDIYGVLYPDAFDGAAKRYWTKTIPESMKRADHLICISEYTRNTIQKELGISESKMTVIHNAASDIYRPINDVNWIKQQLQSVKLDAPFILSVGTIEPRKNFERLIEAFVFAHRNAELLTGKTADDRVKLVIVGKKGWDYAGVFERIRKYHLQETVIFLDYVTDDQLIALYNSCLFTVVPSIFEGFGLPALEAMKCGAAVAVAQNTSLPEVVGDAGVLFDPFNVEEIRERINLLLENAALRHELEKKSLARAAQFSWKKTAEQTLGVIRRVAEMA